MWSAVVASGGLCCDCPARNVFNLKIMMPPYVYQRGEREGHAQPSQLQYPGKAPQILISFKSGLPLAQDILHLGCSDPGL